MNICSNADPRSPTPEITRTPLQVKTASKYNITKNVDLRKTFENAQDKEKLTNNISILSVVINNGLQSYDPRSPTQDFEHTPIIIASKMDELTHDNKIIMRLQYKNCASPGLTNSYEELDNCVETKRTNSKLIVPLNLCNKFYDMNLSDIPKEIEALLCSSTASTENIEGNIPKINCQSSDQPTQLLETNFVYAEDNTDKFKDSTKTINPSNNIDKAEDNIECIPVLKILVDPRSPSIGINRSPIVVSTNIIDTTDVNVEDMSDDILIKILQHNNAKLCQSVAKSCDKNDEGLLIYEDDCVVLNETPKKCKSSINTGSRTPLSCMMNKADAGHRRSKSANLLSNPKTQKVVSSKVSKRVSHVPRLKSLSKHSNLFQTGRSISLKDFSKKIAVVFDCENTPLQSHCDLWDENNNNVL